ncbi:MAG: PAS domain-containing protein [Candidatus Dadabacteria bacterium]|nr:PAS domain-containing protein [Candidatus Dadabacteria bacterium]
MQTVTQIEPGLKRYLTLRLIVATLLLGAGAILYFKYGGKNEAFFLLFTITIVYLHTLLYFLLFPILSRYLQWSKIALIGSEFIIASAVVALTGGQSSPFIFLYAIIIIVTGIMFSKVACYISAGVSWALYLLIAIYQFNLEFSSSSLVTSQDLFLDESMVTHTVFNLAGFLLIGMLSGYLSERIRETGMKLIESSKSLRKLQNLHENILQSITSGVITLDFEGGIISVNRMALEILGKDGEDSVLGRDFSSIFSNTKIEDIIFLSRIEIDYINSEGSELILGLSASTLRDEEGESMGYIIVFQDLTDIKELEKRLRISEKLALFGQLAAGLAHEIRNPLSAISGALEIIGDDIVKSEENQRLMNIATNEVEKLNYLVEDFLILTRPNNNPDGPVDVNGIVHETIDFFLTAVRRKDLVVNADCCEEQLFVMGNPHRLKQVMWNLLQNALQAMPDGGSIVVETGIDDGTKVFVKVKDEGVGINDEIKSQIFEPFFTTKEVGTGLGLAIVQKVVDGCQGSVNVLSSVGNGTTFVITLPRYFGPDPDGKQ